MLKTVHNIEISLQYYMLERHLILEIGQTSVDFHIAEYTPFVRMFVKLALPFWKTKKTKVLDCARFVLRCAANRTSISQKMKQKLKNIIFKAQHRHCQNRKNTIVLDCARLVPACAANRNAMT